MNCVLKNWQSICFLVLPLISCENGFSQQTADHRGMIASHETHPSAGVDPAIKKTLAQDHLDTTTEFQVYVRNASWQQIFDANDGIYAEWKSVGRVSLEQPIEIPDGFKEIRIDCLGYDSNEVASFLTLIRKYRPTAVLLSGNISQTQLRQLCEDNPQLTSLSVTTDATDLSCLGALINLRELYLNGSKSRNYNFVRKLPALRVFEDRGAEKITDLSPLSSLVDLEALRLGLAQTPQHLESLDAIRKLKRLTLGGSGMAKVKQVAFIDEINDLEELNLEGLDLLELPNMAGFKRLRSLRLTGCQHLQFPLPVHSPDLERLQLLNVRMDSLEPFFGSNALQTLEIQSTSLTDFSNISKFTKLRKLSISSEPSLDSFEKLDALSELEELNVEGCPNLQDVRQIETLPQLSKMTFIDCPKITRESPGIEAVERRGVQVSVF